MGTTVIGGQLSWKHALGVAGVIFVLSYAALHVWSSQGHSLPQNSWIAVGVIAVMAGFVLFMGNEVRVYLRGDSERPLPPQRARSTLVAAQACVLAGAAFTGWYAGTVAANVDRLQTATGPKAFILALVLTVACIGLVATGLVVQWWCKLPEDDEKKRRDSSPRGEVA